MDWKHGDPGTIDPYPNPFHHFFSYCNFEFNRYFERITDDSIFEEFYQNNNVVNWLKSLKLLEKELPFTINLFHFLCAMTELEYNSSQAGLKGEHGNSHIFMLLKIVFDKKFKKEIINKVNNSPFINDLKANGFRSIPDQKQIQEILNNIKDPLGF